MGMKTAGSGGMNIIDRDVRMEDMNIGKASQKAAKARKTGCGIGGLLGTIAGVALAPFTGSASLLVTAGLAAVGSNIGGNIGESMSGVNVNEDIINAGKFRKQTRANIGYQFGDMAQNEMISGAISGVMYAGFIGGGLDAFKAGAAAPGGGLMGGL